MRIMMERPKRTKGKVSRIMLVVIVANVVWFTTAVLAVAFFRGVEISSTLISCWFRFWGVELLALAGIKITKVIKGDSAEPPLEIESGDETDA